MTCLDHPWTSGCSQGTPRLCPFACCTWAGTRGVLRLCVSIFFFFFPFLFYASSSFFFFPFFPLYRRRVATAESDMSQGASTRVRERKRCKHPTSGQWEHSLYSRYPCGGRSVCLWQAGRQAGRQAGCGLRWVSSLVEKEVKTMLGHANIGLQLGEGGCAEW